MSSREVIRASQEMHEDRSAFPWVSASEELCRQADSPMNSREVMPASQEMHADRSLLPWVSASEDVCRQADSPMSSKEVMPASHEIQEANWDGSPATRGVPVAVGVSVAVGVGVTAAVAVAVGVVVRVALAVAVGVGVEVGVALAGAGVSGEGVGDTAGVVALSNGVTVGSLGCVGAGICSHAATANARIPNSQAPKTRCLMPRLHPGRSFASYPPLFDMTSQ